MLTIRKPTPLDLPPLFNLAMDQGAKFLDDFHTFDLEYAQQIRDDPNTLVIDDSGFACGVVWFDEKRDNLHSSIHFLLKPEYWRKFYQQGLPEQTISRAFEEQGVERFYAYTMDNQKTAIRLLKRLGFYSHLPWRSHTRQKGKKRDVTFHELKRSTWSKKHG